MNRFITLFTLLFLSLTTQSQEWEQFEAPKDPVSGLGILRNLQDKLFIVASDGLYRSKDGGDHWSRIRDYQPTDGFRLFEVDKQTNRLYYSQALDTSGFWALYSSADFGDNWSKIGNARAGVHAFIGDTIYGPEFGPTTPNLMRKWGNNPWEIVNTWPFVTAGHVYIVRNIGNQLWVLAKNGVYQSLDAGQTWNLRLALNDMPNSFSPGEWVYMEVTNSEVVIANEFSNKLYFSADLGNNWQTTPWPGKSLHNSGQAILATDSSGVQLLQFQGGSASNWISSSLNADIDIELDGVGSFNGTEWLLSKRFGVARKKLGQTTWEITNGDLSPYGSTVISFFDGNLFTGTLAQSYSDDNGNTWKQNFQYSPLSGDQTKPFWSNGSHNYYLANFPYNGSTIVQCSKNQRFEWHAISTLPDFANMLTALGDTLLAPSIAAPNRLFRSFNNGATWNTISIPFLNLPMQTSKNNLYLVFDKSLYRSEDIGQTWQVAHTFLHDLNEANVKLFIVHDTLLVTDPTMDLIYYSTDNGHTFSTLPAPQNASTNAFRLYHTNGILLLQMDDGLLYLSKNVGQSWTSLPLVNGSIPWTYIYLGQVAFGNNTLFTGGNWRLRLDNKRMVTGQVFLDLNSNNQQDIGEHGLNNFLIRSQQGGLGSTYGNGNYSMLVGLTSDGISVANIPANFLVTPNIFNIPSGTAAIPPVSFAVQPQGSVNDASINLVASSAFRAGYENRLFVQVDNPGTVPNNGQVKLALSPVLTYLSAAPMPSSVIGDTLIWDYNNLMALGQIKIQIDLKVAVVAPGTAVKISADLISTQDLNPLNNQAFLEGEVVSSYDPNDKSVSSAQIAVNEIASTDLTYTIRFQNLGNIATDFITVRDTLSNALDVSSVRVLAASHPFTWRVEAGNIMVFRFNPISLSPATIDSLQSQGFVQFAVRLMNDLQVGDEIANTAHIYFDFNPAVVTNTVVTDIKVVATFEPQLERFPLIAYPNPANNEILLELPEGAIANGRLEIFSVSGKVIYALDVKGNSQTIDLQTVASGSYWCRWVCGNSVYWAKIIVSH